MEHQLKKLKLYECMNKENYLELLTKKLSEFCDNPVLTVDYMNKVHSYYGKGINTSLTWNDMIEKGELDPKWIQSFFHETMKKLIEKQEPMRIYYEQSNIILTPVITQGVYMGMIAVLEKNHQLNENELEYTNIMADILSVYCEREGYYSENSEYDHLHIIHDLLLNKIKSKEELEKRMIERSWNASNKYRVYIVNISNLNHFYCKHIVTYIKSMFTNCKPILFEEYILILEELKENKLNEKLITYIKSIDIKTSISDSFDDLFDLNIYVRQANLVHQMNHKDKVVTYNKYRMIDFIHQINKLENINTYLHQDIYQLYELDIHLFNTLFIYLKEDKSILKTSLTMNVHKNTINYRINKIKEKYPNIFNNSETEFHALLTCYLLNKD